MSNNKSNLVVKTHQLNEALQNLTLTEIRMIQLAIVDARESGNGLSTDKPLCISALRYAEVFHTTRQNAYKRLQEAEETLFSRRFSFTDDYGKKIKSRWISQVRYLQDEGAIEIAFTPAVVTGISRIDGAEDFFTSYLLDQTTAMTSNYSVRLYELLSQWKKAKKTPVFELETFRYQLGVKATEYQSMSNFKKRVLDLAVGDINKHTDIKVSYENEKKGRKIIGFKFTILENKKNDKATVNCDIKDMNGDLFTVDNLSHKQLKRIVRHKEFIKTYGHLTQAGASWNDYDESMTSKIKLDPQKFFKKRAIKEYLNDDAEMYDYS